MTEDIEIRWKCPGCGGLWFHDYEASNCCSMGYGFPQWTKGG